MWYMSVLQFHEVVGSHSERIPFRFHSIVYYSYHNQQSVMIVIQNNNNIKSNFNEEI